VTEWFQAEYRDFDGVPRSLLCTGASGTFFFLSRFDAASSAYAGHYEVYRLRPMPEGAPCASWFGLETDAIERLVDLPVRDFPFDPARRKFLPYDSILTLLQGRDGPFVPARPITVQEENNMDPVVHFEMPYDDAARMSRFYQSAFQWNMTTTGAETGHYVLAVTTESDMATGPKKPGAINGGFFQRKPDWPGQHPSVVISVDDIKDAMSRIGRAGGKVLGEPMDIPGVGKYVSFNDTEGNRVGMLQPLPRGGQQGSKT